VEESGGEYSPFLIFPEGTCSNGSHLLPYKQGAFLTEKAIKPIVLKYSAGTMSPAFDCIDILPLVIMMLCWGCYTCDVTILPDFEPNEYLFEEHKDKGK